MLLLCNPHNPTGHRFDRDELTRLASIAERFDLLIISDEIHADLHLRSGGTHLPDRGDLVRHRCANRHPALCLEGVQHRRHAPRRGTRGARLDPSAHGDLARSPPRRDQPGRRRGDRSRLARRRRVLGNGGSSLTSTTTGVGPVDLLAEHLADVRYGMPRATYLALLDCVAFGSGDEPFDLFERRGVQLSPGTDFGAAGAGHVRLNFATSRSLLQQIVERMAG